MKLYLAFFVIFLSAFTLGDKIPPQKSDLLERRWGGVQDCGDQACYSQDECCSEYPSCRFYQVGLGRCVE